MHNTAFSRTGNSAAWFSFRLIAPAAHNFRCTNIIMKSEKILLLCILGMLLLLSETPALAGDSSALEKAIKAWTEESAIPTYKYAFVDLNDDGIDDAVVLINDNQYCGAGGCSFIVFRGVSGGFKLVSSSTITREPILLLPEKMKGWHTLSVFVAGGGAKPGQVIMRFNGERYPGNPSMQPKAKKNDLKNAKELILKQTN